MPTVVTTFAPFGTTVFEIDSSEVGISYGGGDEARIQRSSSGTVTFRQDIGYSIPSSIDGNATTIQRVTAYIYSEVAPAGNINLNWQNMDRVDDPNASAGLTSNSTFNSTGTNTYKVELTSLSQSWIDNSYTFWIGLTITTVNTTIRLQGMEVEWDFTSPSAPPYTVFKSLLGGHFYSHVTNAGSAWGAGNWQYTRYDNTAQKMMWDLGCIVPIEVDGHSITLETIDMWQWNSSGSEDAAMVARSYDFTRINDTSPTVNLNSSDATWVNVPTATFTWEASISPAHTMVDGNAYSLEFSGNTAVGGSPRVQGLRVEYTVES